MQRVSTPFRPTRSKGQCFLQDARYIERIVDVLAPRPDETLVEIGAGGGQLTIPLLETGASVIAIEADRRLATALKARELERLDVIERDASKLDFDALVRERGLDSVRAVGNLPYSVAAPILLRLLSAAAAFSSLTLMFQKEVAERLVAKPSTRDYSFLSVVAQQAAEVRVLFRIPPEAFRPRPRVTSALVQLDLHHADAPDFGTESRFRAVVRGLLAHRRKTIANNIKYLDSPSLPRKSVAAALEALAIDPSRRAETLSVEEFAAISRICTSAG